MILNLFDKIYLINLKRRPDRLAEFFINNKNYIKESDVEIFEAIDGSNVNDPEWKFEKGALGCWLSHVKLLDQISRTSYNRVLILEDDAIIERFDSLENKEIEDFILNENWDMFYFGGYHHKPPTKVSEEILKYNWTLTTHAYAIKKEIIPKILAYTLPRKYWIDGVFAELHSILNVYGPEKTIIGQTGSVSDIVTIQKNIKTKIAVFLKLNWLFR